MFAVPITQFSFALHSHSYLNPLVSMSRQCSWVDNIDVHDASHHLTITGTMRTKHLRPLFLYDLQGYFTKFTVSEFGIGLVQTTYDQNALTLMLSQTDGEIFAKCLSFKPDSFNIELEVKIK